MSTRRQFIKQAALGTGGLLLSSSFLANAIVPRKKKVIIIGGGFAGLMAGYILSEKKIDFEIIEARKRVGGRVHSVPIGPDNFMVELGAEWVGADHPLLLSLCDKFDLTLHNNQFESSAIYNGKYYPSVDALKNPKWEEKLAGILKDYHNMPDNTKEKLDRILDKTDWWRYLVDNGCDQRDLDIRDLLDSTDFGECIREVSALMAMGEYSNNIKSSHNQMDLKIEGGNSRLATTLASMFEGKVHLGRSVIRVVQTTRGVKVHCSDGYMAEGTHLICTAPTFAVAQIKWEPGLPPDLHTALHGLQYARINKNAILYSQRFWDRDDFDMITDMPGHYFYHATKNQTRGKNSGVLISYTIGDKAAVIASQQNEERINLADQSLKAAFPYTGSLATDQLDYYWGNDKMSMGAYAVYGKGQWFDLFPKLRRKFINTHFAGEHLSDMWGGFMEGALETGRDAVLAILG